MIYGIAHPWPLNHRLCTMALRHAMRLDPGSFPWAWQAPQPAAGAPTGHGLVWRQGPGSAAAQQPPEAPPPTALASSEAG